MSQYTVRTIENREKILDLVSQGKSQKTIAKEIGIAAASISTWIRTDHEFAADYARAKDDAADMFAEKQVDLAEEAMEHPEMAQAVKVASELYRWSAGVIRPKKYGTRLEQHVISETPEPEEVMARIVELEKALGMRQEPVVKRGRGRPKKVVVKYLQ